MKTHILMLLVVGLLIAPAVGTGQGNGASDAKQPLALGDVLAWKSIANATVSNDGQWFAYRLGPTEGDAEVVVRSTVDDMELRFAAGERRQGRPVRHGRCRSPTIQRGWPSRSIPHRRPPVERRSNRSRVVTASAW